MCSVSTLQSCLFSSLWCCSFSLPFAESPVDADDVDRPSLSVTLLGNNSWSWNMCELNGEKRWQKLPSNRHCLSQSHNRSLFSRRYSFNLLSFTSSNYSVKCLDRSDVSFIHVPNGMFGKVIFIENSFQQREKVVDISIVETRSMRQICSFRFPDGQILMSLQKSEQPVYTSAILFVQDAGNSRLSLVAKSNAKQRRSLDVKPKYMSLYWVKYPTKVARASTVKT